MKKALPTFILLACGLLLFTACKQDPAKLKAELKTEIEAEQAAAKQAQDVWLTSFVEAINSGNADTYLAQYAPDAVIDYANAPEGSAIKGTEGIRKELSSHYKAFPDMKFELKRYAAVGEYYLVEGTVKGTNTGSMTAPDGKEMKPTGKPLNMDMAFTLKVQDGKVVEDYSYWDNLAFMEQMGLMK